MSLAYGKERDDFALKLRRRIASVFLNTAEKLPTFNGTIIATLQEIRREQRRDAADALKKAEPPPGCELRYSRLRLCEVFPLEDYNRMERMLRKLFPVKPLGDWDYLGDFRDIATSLGSGGRTTVGYLLKSAPKVSLPLPYKVLETLPDEVEAVWVELRKMPPSAVAVCMDVTLSDSANERLRNLESQSYLPEVLFRRWIPRGLLAGGYSQGMGDDAREKVIGGWLTDLRSRVESSLRPYINGYFSAEFSHTSPCLPAIEIFTLHGVPNDGTALAWLNGTHRWLNTVGVNRATLQLYGFKSSDCLFVLTNRGETRGVPDRVFWIASAPKNSEQETHQQLELRDMLDTALPLVLLRVLLLRTQTHIEALREAVYKRPSGKDGFTRFRRDFRINRHLQRESMLLSRLEIELQQSRDFLKLELRPLEALVSMFQKSPSRNLAEVLLSNVEWRSRIVREHLALVSKLFSDYLSWRLQGRLLFWTVVVSFATLIALLLSAFSIVKDFMPH